MPARLAAFGPRGADGPPEACSTKVGDSRGLLRVDPVPDFQLSVVDCPVEQGV
jgi:hypothetical protein